MDKLAREMDEHMMNEKTKILINQWVKGCVSHELLNEWTIQAINQGINEWMIGSTTNKWIDENKNGRCARP